MQYVVFEDLESGNHITSPSDLPVKIHKATCRFWVAKKINAPTVRWLGPFNTLNDAEGCARELGKPWKRAQCCP